MPGIGDLAKDSGMHTPQVKAVFDALVARVKSGQVVSIQGLGNFRVADRKATKARNPQTGEQFDVPETKRLKFTASKTLKETLNAHVAPRGAAKAKAPKAAPTPATA